MKVNELYKKPEWFTTNIEHATLDNTLYRDVLFTGNDLQLVVMSIEPEWIEQLRTRLIPQRQNTPKVGNLFTLKTD